ncbi:hypothetical protein CMEL01_05215, partial [Colletotrichum melonis]
WIQVVVVLAFASEQTPSIHRFFFFLFFFLRYDDERESETVRLWPEPLDADRRPLQCCCQCRIYSIVFFAEITWLGSVSLFVLALATSTGCSIPTQSAHTPAYTSLLKTLGAGRCWNILSSGLTYFITAFWIINVNISHQLQPSLSLSSWRIDPRFRLTSNTKYPHHSPIASSTVISRFSYEYSSFSVLCTTCEAARCQEAARSLSVPRHNQVVKLVYGYGTQSCGLPTVGPNSD